MSDSEESECELKDSNLQGESVQQGEIANVSTKISVDTPLAKKRQQLANEEPVALGRSRGRGRGSVSEKQRTAQRATARPSTVPPAAPPAPQVDAHGALPMVNGQSRTDLTESYSDDEKALNLFTKLHPMLSLDATSQRSLQLVANLVGQTSIPTKDVPVVPRSHDTLFLRPPDERVGERACCLGQRCICRFIALMRHGEDTPLAFVGREFLLPEEHKVFVETGKLPQQPGKCLLCNRYLTTYIFRLARLNPSFCSSSPVEVQAFGNIFTKATGDDYPISTASIGDADGYPQSAMLVCDSDFANTDASRGPMGTFQWRPVVGFNSSHYVYRLENGRPCIVQHFPTPAIRSEL